VLDGLFALVTRLFDVEIVAADGKAPVWNKDVRFFQINRNGQPAAYFYLDPYSVCMSCLCALLAQSQIARAMLSVHGRGAPKSPSRFNRRITVSCELAALVWTGGSVVSL
jgi:oligopeptidase A